MTGARIVTLSGSAGEEAYKKKMGIKSSTGGSLSNAQVVAKFQEYKNKVVSEHKRELENKMKIAIGATAALSVLATLMLTGGKKR